ncbi:MAG: NAD-dependent epimerase/dehydratase family protein [Patescibacteria group bacterium]
MAKCLVTGGAGFVGSNLVDELIKKGHKVAVIDNLSTGRKEYLNQKAKFYKFDVGSKKVEKIFKAEKPDFVFHLAAQIDVRKSVADPVFDNKVNALGSINIFSACAKSKVKKIIFISTGGAMYGDTVRPAGEKTLPAPDSPYAVHKLAAEKYLEIFSKLYGLDYIILRPANIYGPRQYKGGEGAVIAVFTYNASSNKESIIYGDGRQTRDFVYVGDVVSACLKATGKGRRGVINISSGRETDLFALIKEIEKVTRKKMEFAYRKARPGEVRRSVLDNSLAKKVLGWEPKISLEEGIKKTIDWLNKKVCQKY